MGVSSVGWMTAIAALLIVLGMLALPIWATRRLNKQFPKGFDRTGWNPEGGRVRSFMTKFTWMFGGRG